MSTPSILVASCAIVVLTVGLAVGLIGWLEASAQRPFRDAFAWLVYGTVGALGNLARELRHDWHRMVHNAGPRTDRRRLVDRVKDYRL